MNDDIEKLKEDVKKLREEIDDLKKIISRHEGSINDLDWRSIIMGPARI